MAAGGEGQECPDRPGHRGDNHPHGGLPLASVAVESGSFRSQRTHTHTLTHSLHGAQELLQMASGKRGLSTSNEDGRDLIRQQPFQSA